MGADRLGQPPLAERLADLLAGRLLFHGLLVWLLLAGWLYAVHRFQQRQPWALALVVTPFAYLWVADLFLRWDPNNVVSMQLANRGLGYVGVLAVLPFAAPWPVPRPSWGSAPLARRGGGRLVSAALLVVGIGGALRGEVVGQQTPAPMLRELQLAAHVPDGARFVTQRDFPNERRITGVSHPDFWLPWASGRDTESVQHRVVHHRLARSPGGPPDRTASRGGGRRLARLGVTHVAVINDQAAQPFLASSRFATVWRSPTGPARGRTSPGPARTGITLSTPVAAQARLVRAEAQHLVIEATTGEPTSATIAVAWSPKWHAGVNGRQPRSAGRRTAC